jgi:hypothetical protein
MVVWHGVAGIEGAESLLIVPNLLPFGFDQMKWVLSATACHRARDDAESAGRGQWRS